MCLLSAIQSGMSSPRRRTVSPARQADLGELRFFARLTGRRGYRQQGAREENAKMIVVMELIKNPLVIGLAIMAVIWVVVIYGSEYLNKNVQ
jgi:hypothetical protein